MSEVREQPASRTPASRLSRTPARQALFISLSILLALALIGWVSDRFYAARLHEQQHLHLRLALTPYVNTLAAAVQQRLATVDALHAFVVSHRADADFDRKFLNFAGGLHAGTGGIRRFTVAPGGVVRYVFPAEDAPLLLGWDLLQQDGPADIARRAQDLRSLAITDPRPLRGGGIGIVARRPVNLDDQFWGFVSVVIDLPSLIHEAGLPPGGEELTVALRTADGHVFFGDEAVFSQNPAIHRVDLPQTYWELAAVPGPGWTGRISDRLALFRLWGFTFVSLLTLLIYVALRRMSLLSADIAQRARLAAAIRRDLQNETAERELAQAALHASEERFALFMHHLPGAAFMKDPQGHYVYLNERYEEYFGIRLPDWMGKTAADIFPPDVARQISLTDQRVLETGDPVEVLEQVPQRGEVHTYLTYKFLIRRGDQPLICGIAIDITERQRIQKDRDELLSREQAARAQAEAANRAKDQFLAILSHELRTPLTPVLAATDLLSRNAALGAEFRRLVDMIRRNVELESQLISDLLDLTRITSGKLDLHMQTVDLHAVVRDALELCAREAQAKKLDIRLELDASPSEVRGDRSRLTQVFWNLIGNAVKFTPPGRDILIRSRTHHVQLAPRLRDHMVREDGHAPEKIAVEVIDSGIGIEPSVMRRLFRPFEQGEQTLTRRYGGLGLGLAVSRALVELHGGKLTAHSEGRDRGSTFTVEIPVLAARAAAAPGAGFRPLNILLVEDNLDTQTALSAILRRQGHSIVAAASAQDAIEIAGNSKFDLIISDIGLPDRSGWELMRELRERQPIRGIALSGFGSDDDIRKSRESGFVAHLTKPVNLQKLESLLQESPN